MWPVNRIRRVGACLAIGVLLACGVTVGSVEAQQTTQGKAIAPGDRIRFVAPPGYPEPVTGGVTSIEDGLLKVDRKSSRGGPVVVSIASLSTLEVSVDRKRQTVLGLGIGAGVGLTLGGLLAWAYCDGPDNLCEVEDVALLTAAVAVPFSALGALLGHFTYKDVWQEVRLQ
jgi:hypothetical protein